MHLTELASGDFTQPALAPEIAVEGWGPPEEGGRRALSWRSRLILPRPDWDGDLALILTVEPFLFPPVLAQQMLRVIANGKTVKLAHLEYRTIVVAFVPAAVAALRPSLEITFEHPDAVVPSLISTSSDTRSYSVSFATFAAFALIPDDVQHQVAVRTPSQKPLHSGEDLSDAQLMRHFASLGDNCEFGFAQRDAGAEVSDLLRFAGARLPGLLRGLDCDFAFLERLDEIEIMVRFGTKRELVLHWPRFSMQMHTLVCEGEMPVARFLVRELKKLQLQRRLMLDDLRTGDRILVYKNLEIPRDADMTPLERSLRRHGAATLLQVVPAQSTDELGCVEQIRPGFMRGYIDRFNPYDNAAARPSLVWREVCRKAYAIWRDR